MVDNGSVVEFQESKNMQIDTHIPEYGGLNSFTGIGSVLGFLNANMHMLVWRYTMDEILIMTIDLDLY